MKTQVWSIEHTDTFGGEANYSWCNRSEIAIPESYSRSWIVRRIKDQLGWTGDKVDVEEWDVYYTLRHCSSCQIAFATLKD